MGREGLKRRKKRKRERGEEQTDRDAGLSAGVTHYRFVISCDNKKVYENADWKS